MLFALLNLTIATLIPYLNLLTYQPTILGTLYERRKEVGR